MFIYYISNRAIFDKNDTKNDMKNNWKYESFKGSLENQFNIQDIHDYHDYRLADNSTCKNKFKKKPF